MIEQFPYLGVELYTGGTEDVEVHKRITHANMFMYSDHEIYTDKQNW